MAKAAMCGPCPVASFSTLLINDDRAPSLSHSWHMSSLHCKTRSHYAVRPRVHGDHLTTSSHRTMCQNVSERKPLLHWKSSKSNCTLVKTNCKASAHNTSQALSKCFKYNSVSSFWRGSTVLRRRQQSNPCQFSMHLSRSPARSFRSRELEKLLSKSLNKKMELPTSWCADAFLATFISFPALLSFNDSAHAEPSSQKVNQIYDDLGAGLELGVQVVYLAALLSLVGVASFFVVKQVLIRRELESAARDLQDRVRTGEALPVEYFELGAVMLRKKFYVLASKYLVQAIDKWDGDPQDLAQVHNALGFSLVSDNKIDKGIAEYEKAVKLQPGYVVAWNNLGSAYEKKKNLPKALEAYEKALLFDPNNSVAREYRDALKKRVERLAGIPVKYD